MRECSICGKPLPKGRRRFCTDKCANRSRHVMRYGLSVEDYAILTAGGKCPICGRKVRRWNVDHHHESGRVRGVVCGTCNQRVLTALTQVEQAKGLLDYLTDPPAFSLPGEERKVGEIIARRRGKYWSR